MSTFQLTYFRFSETSVLVQWPQEISVEILDDILLFKNYLLKYDDKSIVQITNAYNSLLIAYDNFIDSFDAKVADLKSNYISRMDSEAKAQFLWKIPVCYDTTFGLDLETISSEKSLSVSKVIQLHSEAVYKVYFIGFLPGFLYLGGLNAKLFTPRKKSPRQHIEKGAVAIGGEQTGIYPNASPGGWNIIGNSPVEFFNPKLNQPCFAKAGDTIQFVPVDFDTHQNILEKVKNGTYVMESEVSNG